MIERLVEQAILDRIEGMGIGGLVATGLWQPAASGHVKGIEKADSPAAVVVGVPPRSYETFGFCDVSMAIQIVLTVRIDMCPTGSELQAFCKPIQDMLHGWNIAGAEEGLEDFRVQGFIPGGIQISGGSGPELDRQNMTWTISWQMILRGAVAHAMDKTETA